MIKHWQAGQFRPRAAMASAVAATLALGAAALSVAAAPAANAVNRKPAAPADVVSVASHFVWVPSSATDSADATFINNGATNGRKGDLLFVLPNLTPGGISPCPCLLSPAPPVGVWFNGSQWAVFNEDESTMGTLTAFNVLVLPKATKTAFTVVAKGTARSGNHVVISAAAANNNPHALLQVTQNFGPDAVFNPNQVGVRYYKGLRRWVIFNEDGHPMPAGAAFNVLVGSTGSNGGKTALVTTTTSNRAGDSVRISNPETNGNPNNFVLATQDPSPGGKAGKGDTSVLYAGYSGSREALVDWASPAPAVGAAFNLLVFGS
jgi:hypothetical protein